MQSLLTNRRAGRLALATLAVGFVAAVAGPLNPPAGPVAPPPGPGPRTASNDANTPGDADSLFKITQPGSYYLTGNITGVTGKHGIEIAASGVTIDLNGFSLLGLSSASAFDGIAVSTPNLSAITIRNGSIRNWGDDGVDLRSVFIAGTAIIDVRAADNVDVGIAASDNAVINGCSATNNGTGIFVSANSTIVGCAALQNTTTGIRTSSGATISSSTSVNNGGDGFSIANGSTITGCSAFFNSGNGIVASFGSSITACSTYDNDLNGIVAGSGCTVSGCTARLNTLDGIRINSDCVVLNNACSTNGNSAGDGAGIHVLGSDNRIEGNNCSFADRGIDIDFAGNIIIRNTCSGNTVDWDIVANNIYGPIIDRRIPSPLPNTPAVSGTAAASTLGSTDANANFTY